MAQKRPTLELMDLPNEILIEILRNLPLIDINSNCSKINRRFRALVHSEFSTIPHIHLSLPENMDKQRIVLNRFLAFTSKQRPNVVAFSVRGPMVGKVNEYRLFKILESLAPSLRVLVLAIDLILIKDQKPEEPSEIESSIDGFSEELENVNATQRNSAFQKDFRRNAWHSMKQLKTLGISVDRQYFVLPSNSPRHTVSSLDLNDFLGGSPDNVSMLREFYFEEESYHQFPKLKIILPNLKVLVLHTCTYQGITVRKFLGNVSRGCPNLESLSALIIESGYQFDWKQDNDNDHAVTPVSWTKLKTFTIIVKFTDKDFLPDNVAFLRAYPCFSKGKWSKLTLGQHSDYSIEYFLKLESNPKPECSDIRRFTVLKEPTPSWIKEEVIGIDGPGCSKSYRTSHRVWSSTRKSRWFTEDLLTADHLPWKELDANNVFYRCKLAMSKSKRKLSATATSLLDQI